MFPHSRLPDLTSGADGAVVLQPIDATTVSIQSALKPHSLTKGKAAPMREPICPFASMNPTVGGTNPPGFASGQATSAKALRDPCVLVVKSVVHGLGFCRNWRECERGENKAYCDDQFS